MILGQLGSSAGPYFDNTLGKGFDLAAKFVAGPDTLLLLGVQAQIGDFRWVQGIGEERQIGRFACLRIWPS